MCSHKVEAVTVHHVAARRTAAWAMWLAVVPPWAVLFAWLFLHGASGTPAEVPTGILGD